MKSFLLVLLLGLTGPAFSQSPEAKLVQLDLTLPQVVAAIGSYVEVVQVDNLLLLSGKGPCLSNGTYVTSRLGMDLTTAQGYEAARLTALLKLAVLKKVRV
jgi:hypothetical protein